MTPFIAGRGPLCNIEAYVFFGPSEHGSTVQIPNTPTSNNITEMPPKVGTKKTRPYFPLYWLFNTDPYYGLIIS